MSVTPTDPVRLAIIGAGAMAAMHAESYATIAGASVAAVCSRTRTRAAELAGPLGAAATSDINAVLRDSSIEAIDICVPTPEHAHFVLAALDAGKHVFCETPLTLQLDAALAMREAARRRGLLLQVGLLCRSIASYAEIRRQFLAGHLGRPISASAYRLGSYLHPAAPDHKPHYSDPTTELMTFDFDALNWIFGPPDGVSAHAGASTPGGTPGHVFATLQYPDFVASVEAGGLMPPSFPFQLGLRITGSSRAIEMAATFAPDGPPESSVTEYPFISEPAPVAIDDHDPYEAECRHFIDCVRGEADLGLLDVDRAIETLRLSLATQEAIRTRAYVPLT